MSLPIHKMYTTQCSLSIWESKLLSVEFAYALFYPPDRPQAQRHPGGRRRTVPPARLRDRQRGQHRRRGRRVEAHRVQPLPQQGRAVRRNHHADVPKHRRLAGTALHARAQPARAAHGADAPEDAHPGRSRIPGVGAGGDGRGHPCARARPARPVPPWRTRGRRDHLDPRRPGGRQAQAGRPGRRRQPAAGADQDLRFLAADRHGRRAAGAGRTGAGHRSGGVDVPVVFRLGALGRIREAARSRAAPP